MNVKRVWKRWLEDHRWNLAQAGTSLGILHRLVASRPPPGQSERRTLKQRLSDAIHYWKYLKLRQDPNYRPVQGFQNRD